MIILMKKTATKDEITTVINAVNSYGFRAEQSRGENRAVILVAGNAGHLDKSVFGKLDGVGEVVQVSGKLKKVYREENQTDSRIDLGKGVVFGGSDFNIIAGPCSVESREQVMETAAFLSSRGIRVLRGGAFKPRTSPYSFQGLEEKGLDLLTEAAEKYNMLTVTEAIDEYSLALIAERADVVQIGARNMQNYALLKRCAKLTKPILLKRGVNATLDDLLVSVEYILAGGNSNVIICERGIRGIFGNSYKSAVDFMGISDFKHISPLPVIVDPSHASRARSRVIPLSRASAAYGCDGLMVEVHPRPDEALSDGPQSLTFDLVDKLLKELDLITEISGKKLKLFNR